jgi:Uma2 family endonuclease
MYHVPHDGRKYELIEGELTVSPAGLRHEGIGGNLVFELKSYLKVNPIGQVFGSSAGYQLAENILLSPDVSFVRTERLPGGRAPDGFGEFAPDLAVEIISPGDGLTEVEQKVQLYLSHGTKLVWVINPMLVRATIYRPDGSARVLQAQDSLEGEDVLPGFICRLTDVLAGLI